jgi:hypothetical protein
VDRFRCQREKIPEHVRIRTVSGRMPLLSMDEIRKFEWIPALYSQFFL